MISFSPVQSWTKRVVSKKTDLNYGTLSTSVWKISTSFFPLATERRVSKPQRKWTIQILFYSRLRITDAWIQETVREKCSCPKGQKESSCRPEAPFQVGYSPHTSRSVIMASSQREASFRGKCVGKQVHLWSVAIHCRHVWTVLFPVCKHLGSRKGNHTHNSYGEDIWSYLLWLFEWEMQRVFF